MPKSSTGRRATELGGPGHGFHLRRRQPGSRHPESRRAALCCFVFTCLGLSLTFLPCTAAAVGHGSLVGVVFAPDGRFMDSVQVALEGPSGLVETVADDQGRFRIAELEPGSYSLEIRRHGEIVARYEPVSVRMGRPTNVEVQVRTDPDGTLVVTSEPPEPAVASAAAPRIDREAVGWVDADRDPFRAAQQAGVEVGRNRAVDNERAEPGPSGAAPAPAWRLDGMPLAEAPSSLPSGVRVQVLSAADAARGSAEPVIDLLSPRGTASRRLELSTGISDRSWNDSPATASDPRQERLVGVLDAGLEGGLQLAGDRLWGWGSWRTQEVMRRALGGQETRTESGHLALKLQAELHASASVVLSLHDADRRSEGEGAGLDRSFEATGLELAPNRLASLSSALVFGSSTSFDLQYAEARDAASLLPRSSATSDLVLDSSGVWRGGIAELRHREDRRQLSLRGDVSVRRTTSSLRFFDHRVRFGYQQRDSATSDLERWGRANLQFIAGENLGTPFDLVRARRSGELQVQRRFQGIWVQDTISRERVSLDFGLRLDRQSGWAEAGSLEAHPLLPELLPALEYDGRGSALEWVDYSPRLGLTWALTRDRDTILRFSRASFASELHSGLVGRVSPLAGGEVLLALGATGGVGIGPPVPLDGVFVPPAGIADPDEGFAPGGLLRLVASRSHDVFDPSGQANALASSLDSERIDEMGLSLEHHVGRTELTLRLSERLVSDVLERRLYVRDEQGLVRVAQSHDYRLDTVATGFLPDGAPYAVPVYGLAEGLTYTGGSMVANGDRRQRRRQAALGFHRSLADGFQIRGHATWTDWLWELGSSFSRFDDPTDEVADVDGSGVSTADGAGDASSLGRETGPGSRWAFDVTALLQVARSRVWGFDVAASVHGREGYALDYFVDSVSDRSRRLDVTGDAAATRLDDVLTVDLRLQKDLRLGSAFGGMGTALALDVYNLFDQGAVLAREASLTSPAAGDVRRTLSPRVFQIGLRLALP